MGERKGTNKYYPPDYDPKKGGLNKFMGTHALRERARKLHLGIIIIRFEMPYNIWCEGCNNHIGMGVRYNAEKTKVGMYYSTPVYQFRMKCHLCDNHFEIKTDPGNLDYVIISGARRQERRWDPTENGQVVPDDKQVIHKLADDAMFKLQHGVEDQKKLKDVTPSLSKLENLQERWKDDYMANRALRDVFRTRKREIQDQQAKDNDFLKKRSLDIQLLPESEDDAKVASLIRLQPSKSSEERQQEKRAAIEKKSQFPCLLGPTTSASISSSATAATSTSSSDEKEMSNSDSQLVPTRVQLQSSLSSLESRRKSFGIKLKSDKNYTKPSGPTSSSTSSTSELQEESVCKVIIPVTNESANADDTKVVSVSNEEGCHSNVSTCNYSSVSDGDCSSESVITRDDNSCKEMTNVDLNLSSPKTASSLEASSSSSGSGSSKRNGEGSLSCLVTYSDDSSNSNSSAGSESD